MLTFDSPTSSRDKVATPRELVPPQPLLPVNPVEQRPSKRLSTEGSFIPGETEEDGLLRREYVLVGDTRAVEFNRAVDGEIDSSILAFIN